MKGKLMKQGGRYVLYAEGGHKIACTSDSPHEKLSLKNCQAIGRGYDLEDLVGNYINKDIYEDGYDGLIKPHTETLIKLAYIEGFLKAIELMGDKKFSEEDIHEVYSLGESEDRFGFHDFLQQNNQTEWDVEIEMEYIGECSGNNNNGCFQDSPGHDCGCFQRKLKLDADGCLVLKPKSE